MLSTSGKFWHNRGIAVDKAFNFSYEALVGPVNTRISTYDAVLPLKKAKQ